MTISSAQPTYSVTSSDTLDFSSLDTITITNGGSGYSSDTITISGGSCNTFTVTGAGSSGSSGYHYTTGAGISITNISVPIEEFKIPEEWINCFPEWDRIEKMCELYPGLKIAFEKFKTTYKLVKDDYDTPPEKRIKP